jgi:hypothetical protein
MSCEALKRDRLVAEYHNVRYFTTKEKATKVRLRCTTQKLPKRPFRYQAQTIPGCLWVAYDTTADSLQFLFRVERNLIEEMSNKASDTTAADPTLSMQEFYAGILRNQSAFIDQVLHDHWWSRDPIQMSKHHKVHGKISFQALTRRIAANCFVQLATSADLTTRCTLQFRRRWMNDGGVCD